MLHEPLANVELVELVHYCRHLLDVRLAGQIEAVAHDSGAAAVHPRPWNSFLAAGDGDLEEAREQVEELRHLVARHTTGEHLDDGLVNSCGEVAFHKELGLGRLHDGLEAGELVHPGVELAVHSLQLLAHLCELGLHLLRALGGLYPIVPKA